MYTLYYMEKLAVLSHVLFNKELLYKTNTLKLYTVKKIKMSQSHYDKYSKLCIQNLEKITYDTIIYRERLYYDLIDVDDRIHLVFTDDYYKEILLIMSLFIKNTKYAILIDTISTILFNCIRSSSISCANIWGTVQTFDSFYNILEYQLFSMIHTQFLYIRDKYFELY